MTSNTVTYVTQLRPIVLVCSSAAIQHSIIVLYVGVFQRSHTTLYHSPVCWLGNSAAIQHSIIVMYVGWVTAQPYNTLS